MKFVFTIFLGIILSLNLVAQPSTITYQGKLLDNNGLPLNSSSVTLTFAIYDASTNGNQVWPASGVVSKNVAVNFGLYSVTLGTGVSNDDAFTASNLSGSALYLEVSVAGNPLPRTLLTTVPYAIVAKELADWSNQPIVPSGFMISSTTSTAPSGYTYSNISINVDSIVWKPKADMPTARRMLGAAKNNAGTKIFAIGGFNGTFLSTNEEYNVVSNSWTTKTSMATARRGFGCENYNDKIYVVFGYDSVTASLPAEEYNISTNFWTTKGTSTVGYVSSFGSAQVGNTMYCMGGSSGGDGQFSTASATAFSYNVATDVYTILNIPVAGFSYFWFNGTSAVNYNNKVYFGGGVFHDSKLINEYDPGSGITIDFTQMPLGLKYFGMEKVGNKIVFIGGTTGGGRPNNQSPQSKTYFYDMINSEWSDGPDIPVPTWGAASVVIGNSIYLIGGTNGTTNLDDVQELLITSKKLYFYQKD